MYGAANRAGVAHQFFFRVSATIDTSMIAPIDIVSEPCFAFESTEENGSGPEYALRNQPLTLCVVAISRTEERNSGNDFRPSAATAPVFEDSLPGNDARREFAFSDADFKFLAELAYEHSGIVLSDAKRNLAYGRLSRRLRVLKLSSFREYRSISARTGGNPELHQLNLDQPHRLFRESHHFDHFRAYVVKPIAQSTQSQRIRIWSAGCSSGEEPTRSAGGRDRARHQQSQSSRHPDAATDIDTGYPDQGAARRITPGALEEVPRAVRPVFFPRTAGQRAAVEVPEKLRSMIAFRQSSTCWDRGHSRVCSTPSSVTT